MIKNYRSSTSPWSSNADFDNVLVGPISTPIKGCLSIPGSKSYTNRALIVAAAAYGESKIEGVLRSEDSYWCIEALRLLGADITVDGGSVTVKGTGGEWASCCEEIFIGSGGTTARFLCPILAMTVDHPIKVVATEQLSSRPMKELFNAVKDIGGDIEYLGLDGCFPVLIKPCQGLSGGSLQMSGAVSSQFISGILLGAVFAKEKVSLTITNSIVQENYVQMTCDVINHFGANIVSNQNLRNFEIEPSRYIAKNYIVEADASTASYFFALAAVTNGKIKIDNLNSQCLQPDIQVLNIFQKMGCDVDVNTKNISVSGPKKLNGDLSFDMNQCSDTALTIAAIAPFSSGPITITGVSHIRKHESDRISVMVDSLKRLGINAIENEDGMKIYPGEPEADITLPTYDDHRVIMSLSVLAAAGKGMKLEDPKSVSKTCPDFFNLIGGLGVNFHVI